MQVRERFGSRLAWGGTAGSTHRGSRLRLPAWSPPRALFALAASYVILFWFNPFGDPVLNADSFSYLFFSRGILAAGYPLFLDLASAAFGTAAVVPKVQLVLLATTVSFLGWSVYRTLNAPCLALILTLTVFALSALTRFHSKLVTEALFVPLLCAMAGTLTMLVARPTLRLATISALLCGLAIATRSAVSLLAIWPALLWLVWKRCSGQRTRLIVAVVVPLACCSVAERALSAALQDRSRGMHKPSLLHRHLFAKALMLDSAPALRDSELANLFSEARQVTAPLRALVAGAADWQARVVMLASFEIAAQHPTYSRLFYPWVEELAERRGVSGERVLADMFWPALRAAPREWAANAWLHYRGLWGHGSIYGEAVAQRQAAAIGEAAGSLLLQEALPGAWARPRHRWLTRFNEFATVAAFIVSVAALACAGLLRLRGAAAGPPASLAMAALAALVVHGYFALTAVLAESQMRYSAAMWPYQALCGLLFLHWALGPLRRALAGTAAAERWRRLFPGGPAS